MKKTAPRLPQWASEVIAHYSSRVSGCFLLHGNVNDHLLLPRPEQTKLGRLQDFILEMLLPRFDVVLSYDIGQGLKVERGGQTFSEWPSFQESGDLPGAPLPAIRLVNHYLKYCRNLRAMGKKAPQVAVVIRQTHLIIPAIPNALNYELNALASSLKGWASDISLQEHGQVAFCITEQINGIHPLVAKNPRICSIEVPLPNKEKIAECLEFLAPHYPKALEPFTGRFDHVASRLTGATMSSIEALLKRHEHEKKALKEEDLSDQKRKLVEADCDDLIGFVEPDRTLDDVIGLNPVKEWLRQDMTLWHANELEALPMGYLFCGPVGTGKTYLAECLAGEAKVPMVTLRNFRDRWVGSTEANLEKIFSLLHALGRCLVFIDEADQALGQRAGGGGDSGVSSRVYSMIAKEMSNTRNRGRLIWVLASSRPDLIEVDLKRPGRIDVKIPLFPSTDPDETWQLIKALSKKRGLEYPPGLSLSVKEQIPQFLTPGAAEALVVKIYRLHKGKGMSPEAALRKSIDRYHPPVSLEVLKSQTKIAVKEATEPDFIPAAIQGFIGQSHE